MDAEREQVERAMNAKVLQARSDADRLSGRLEAKPFWRWRRRRQILRAIELAEHREQTVRELREDD